MRGLKPCRPVRAASATSCARSTPSSRRATASRRWSSFYGVPDWAALPPTAASATTSPRARARSPTQGLEGLQGAWSRSLQDLAKREGVDIDWWSPWNEPNGPFFISPQREKCSGSSKSLAPAVYTKLAHAMRDELQPGQQMVVGELAGLEERAQVRHARSRSSSTACPTTSSATPASSPSTPTPSAATPPTTPARWATSRTCSTGGRARSGKPIWVTESGVGGPHVGDERSPKDESIRADCQALNVSLRRWNDDPRVDAVFQYTFRDDPVFPVGLADAKLDQDVARLRPVQGVGRRPQARRPGARAAGRLQGLTRAGRLGLRRAPLAGPLRRGPARRHRARSPQRPGHVRRHGAPVARTPSPSTTATSALTFGELDELLRRLRRGARAARRRARRPRRAVPAERPGVRRRRAGGVEARAPSRCRSTRCSRSARCARCSRTASPWRS